MKVIRKDDLIAMLQALPGNPVIVLNNDGGDYWGSYLTFPELETKYVHPAVDNNIWVGHPKPSANNDSGEVQLDLTRSYVIIK